MAAAAAIVLSGMVVGQVDLLTFDGKAPHTVKTVDDPVMGGGSTSTFDTQGGVGIWKGVVRVVPFLGAPGFATMRTMGDEAFPAVEGTKGIEVNFKHSEGLENYSVNIGINGITTEQTVYSAPFQLLPDQAHVRIPWSSFSLTFRGQKIPGPSLVDSLSKGINRVGLSTSGKAGSFEVQVVSIRAAS